MTSNLTTPVTRTVNCPASRCGHRVTAAGQLGRSTMLASGILLMTLSLLVLLSWQADETQLSKVATSLVAADDVPSHRATTILHFVYGNGGFAKNHTYFLVSQFGPTPVQVLKHGGDCDDKSRLLVALLRKVGIHSTPVMLFDDFRHPTHVVVEAEIESGRMELDPVYDLYFPRSDGGFYASAELRKDPQILRDRLERASSQVGKARYYHVETSSYAYASTFNWERNWFTRAAKAVVQKFYGDGVYQLSRPDFIEDPKLMVAGLMAAPALTAFALSVFCTGSLRHKTRELGGVRTVRTPFAEY